MKILFFGDVFGRPGREALKLVVPVWKEKYGADMMIANVENISHGNGINERTLEELRGLGAFSLFTSGDHIWDDGEAKRMLEDEAWLLVRPENFPPETPGTGHKIVNVGAKRVLVFNLLGRSFMRAEVDSPFRAADHILDAYTIASEESGKDRVDAIFVDFHAETTSEKRAMGFYLDGRVSALVGTHTHVPTADAQILPKGTAYLSDSGMVGPHHSVIGLEPSASIERFLTQLPIRKEIAENGLAEIGAVLIEVAGGGKAVHIQQLREIVEIPPDLEL